VFILQSCDILAGGHGEDLSRTVASSCKVFAVAAETHAADNAVMHEVMNKFDIEDTLHFGVENSVPIGALFLLRAWQIIGIPIGEHVPRTVADDYLTWRGRPGEMW